MLFNQHVKVIRHEAVAMNRHIFEPLDDHFLVHAVGKKPVIIWGAENFLLGDTTIKDVVRVVGFEWRDAKRHRITYKHTPKFLQTADNL